MVFTKYLIITLVAFFFILVIHSWGYSDGYSDGFEDGKEVITMTDDKVLRLEQSLECMCRRCVNYEMCQGTGCEPLKVLKAFIVEQDLIDDVIDE